MAVAVPRPELPAGYQVEAIGVLGENEWPSLAYSKSTSTRKGKQLPGHPVQKAEDSVGAL